MNGHPAHPLVFRHVGHRRGVFVLALRGQMGLDFCPHKDDFIAEISRRHVRIVLCDGLVETDGGQPQVRRVEIHPKSVRLQSVALVQGRPEQHRRGPRFTVGRLAPSGNGRHVPPQKRSLVWKQRGGAQIRRAFIEQSQRQRIDLSRRLAAAVVLDDPIAGQNDIPKTAHGLRKLLVAPRIPRVTEHYIEHRRPRVLRCQAFEQPRKISPIPCLGVFLMKLLVGRVVLIHQHHLLRRDVRPELEGQIVAFKPQSVPQRSLQQRQSQPRGKSDAAEDARRLGPRAAPHRGQPGTQCFVLVRHGAAKFNPAARY